MAKAWRVKGIRPKKSYRRGGRTILPVRVEEVDSWSQFIRAPDNITELHNMRISLKRLRYSMELFVINYGEEYWKCLKTVEDLQELLGDIHDCDVIETVLTESLQKASADETAVGINALLLRYRELRAETYQAFVEKWTALEDSDFMGRFLDIVKGKPSTESVAD